MSNKKWQICQKITNELREKFPEFDSAILQMLWNRDIKKKKDINNFLYPNFEKNIYDPFLFNETEKAVEYNLRRSQRGSQPQPGTPPGI